MQKVTIYNATGLSNRDMHTLLSKLSTSKLGYLTRYQLTVTLIPLFDSDTSQVQFRFETTLSSKQVEDIVGTMELGSGFGLKAEGDYYIRWVNSS
jgi:hypothetical protein